MPGETPADSLIKNDKILLTYSGNLVRSQTHRILTLYGTIEYIIKNKIIIPIIDENEDTAQNTKNKEAQIKCRPKQKKNCRFSP
jgi:hypothetical protein